MFRSRLWTSSLLSSLWILLLHTIALAQTSSVDLTINYAEAEISNEWGNIVVSTYVSVIDDQGKPVLSLDESNFALLEDSREMDLDSATLATDPISVVLVVDTSGSMAALTPDNRLAIDIAKEAAVSFISQLESDDKIAVYSFDDDIVLEKDLDIDHGAAINAINFLNYTDNGGTCLYDAMLEAVKKSAEAPQGRRAVIVLTDGVDETQNQETCSNHPLSDVIDAATTKVVKVPIFTIGLGNQTDEAELARLANLTGGRNLNAPNPSELNNLFGLVASQLKNQYLITYLTQAISGEHALVVKVETDSSQDSDERRVFIPVAERVTPTPLPTITPTPIPEVSINIVSITEKKEEGQLEILADLTDISLITQAILYIDGQPVDQLESPPFNRFILDLSELEGGEHIARIEAIDNDQQALMTPNYPFTISVLTPTVIPTTASSALLANSPLVWIAIILGILILIAIVVAVIFIFVYRSKKQVDEVPPPAAAPIAPHGPPTIRDFSGTSNINFEDDHTIDEGETAIEDLGFDEDLTIDEFATIPPAKLIVVESQELSEGESYPINRERTIIGRNTSKKAYDINIPDKSISRPHAEVVFEKERGFVLRDLGSTYGTMVDEKTVQEGEGIVLQPGTTIQLGPRTKLKFN